MGFEMHVKEMKTILSFVSTHDAMEMEEKCREEGMPGRIIPLPSAISAGCGLAWACPVLYKEELLEFCRTRNILFDKATDLMI